MKGILKKSHEEVSTINLSECEFHSLVLCVAFTAFKSETELQFVARDLYKILQKYE